MPMAHRLGAEFFGTFWLVLGGCGSAVLAAGFPDLGIGFAGVARFRPHGRHHGLCGRAYLRRPFQSGGDARPVGGRFPASEIVHYWAAQLAGGIAAAAVLYLIASGKSDSALSGGFASNGYADHSPGGYTLVAALVCEVVMTFFFLVVILGSTDKRAPAGFAPLAIGLALTLIHLISIPVTNTSVNPARSTGPALFVGGWALAQLWLFWVAPLAGAVIGGFAYKWLGGEVKLGEAVPRAAAPAE